MKLLSTIWAGAFCSFFLLNSCSNDSISEVVSEDGGEDIAEISFTVKNFQRDLTPDSRTAIVFPSESGKPTEFRWTAGDTIGIAPNEGAQAYFVINDETANSSTASFSGGAWSLKTDGTSDYAAYYPFIADIYLNREEIPVDYRNQVYRPAENNTLASLAPHDFMAAKPKVAGSTSQVNFEFEHLGALVEVQFTPDETGSITEVALVAGSDVLPYRGTFNLAANEIAITPGEGDYTNTIPVTVEGMTVTEGKATSVFFMMPPAQLSEKNLAFRVTYQNAKIKEYFISEARDIVAGGWCVLSAAASAAPFNISNNEAFSQNLHNALNGATYIKFVTLSSQTSETILAEDGNLKAYAIKNDNWLEVHTSALRIVAAADAEEMFSSKYTNVKGIDFTGFDTSQVTNMTKMFYYNNYHWLDLSSFDTSQVTDMSNMFRNSYNLTSLDLSNFNTSRVESMYFMFSNCQKLTSLDLSSFDTSNVNNMVYMFYDCIALSVLDLSSFTASSNPYVQGMFDSVGKEYSGGKTQIIVTKEFEDYVTGASLDSSFDEDEHMFVRPTATE